MSPEAVDAAAATFQRWLHLPDPSPLLAVLSAVAANRLEGDPVWLVLVGPPGGGKSELLASLSGLDGVHPTATLTEAALLSGTPQKERSNGSKGGLLREIGEFGIVLCKDFGSVLSMHNDTRAAVLAALREVYDGSWTRHVGSDGGKTLHWAGKVGLVAGCTPTIDRHHAVMGAMGERFLLYRLPEVDRAQQASRALAHARQQVLMRQELADAVASVLAGPLEQPRELSGKEREQLVSLTSLVATCRSAVERDGYSREIELIPEPEAPTRLIVQLDLLLAGLDVIGVQRPAAWRIAVKAALDSIPVLRRDVMDALAGDSAELETPELAQAIGYPKRTTIRALEDLEGHGVVIRAERGTGSKPDRWRLSDWARDSYAACVPEITDNLFTTPLRIEEDFSGTQTTKSVA